MLTELDKKLIKREKRRFAQGFKLIPLKDSPVVSSYADLMTRYNLYELTTHWYDKNPDECDYCENDSCKGCIIRDKWDGSEEQLSFNNWIDVEGPGVWGMDQAECNKRAKEIFENKILPDKEFAERTFCYELADSKYFQVFWYNRDRKRFDYWFVFIKKDKKRE